MAPTQAVLKLVQKELMGAEPSTGHVPLAEDYWRANLAGIDVRLRRFEPETVNERAIRLRTVKPTVTQRILEAIFWVNASMIGALTLAGCLWSLVILLES